jgi:hypothetical protein
MFSFIPGNKTTKGSQKTGVGKRRAFNVNGNNWVFVRLKKKKIHEGILELGTSSACQISLTCSSHVGCQDVLPIQD